MLMRPHENF